MPRAAIGADDFPILIVVVFLLRSFVFVGCHGGMIEPARMNFMDPRV